MHRFISAARGAIETKNWYGALAVSLTLPDICGRLENPKTSTKDRYMAWWTNYCQPKYTYLLGPAKEKHVFLSGDDAYALRCAYLHEGGGDITYQNARKVLHDFLFVEPPDGGLVHCNQSNTRLQLQVDIFCNDICDGATSWMNDHKENPDIKDRMKLLLPVHTLANGLAF